MSMREVHGVCQVTTVYNSGGCAMAWAWIAASGRGRPSLIDGTMKSIFCEKTLRNKI